MTSDLAREITQTAILRAFDRFPIANNRPLMTCAQDHSEVWFTGPSCLARWDTHRLHHHGDLS